MNQEQEYGGLSDQGLEVLEQNLSIRMANVKKELSKRQKEVTIYYKLVRTFITISNGMTEGFHNWIETICKITNGDCELTVHTSLKDLVSIVGTPQAVEVVRAYLRQEPQNKSWIEHTNPGFKFVRPLISKKLFILLVPMQDRTQPVESKALIEVLLTMFGSLSCVNDVVVDSTYGTSLQRFTVTYNKGADASKCEDFIICNTPEILGYRLCLVAYPFE